MSVKVIGPVRLGTDPELSEWPDGTPYVRFSAASNESWRDKDKNKQERTTWLRCTLTGKRAEVIDEYVKKGQEIYIEGTLQPDQETGGPRIWFDNEGEANSSYEVRITDFQFIGGKVESESKPKSKKTVRGQVPDDVPW